MKRGTSTQVKVFICESYVRAIKGIVEPAEKLTFYDQVEEVNSLGYLGVRLNANGGREAAVAARTRI